jgi:hypothetical protein
MKAEIEDPLSPKTRKNATVKKWHSEIILVAFQITLINIRSKRNS